MTVQIATICIILVLAASLFISERLRVDVVALLVLGILTVTGLVTPTQAISGFSSPAVITVWAVFILSGGLSQTGVGRIIGQQVLRLAGQGEAHLIIIIMLTAAIMSGFMNNIGVAALLMPVVMDIARRTHRSPSRLLMPLAFGSLLGGLNTLIGTPPNLLVSEALRNYGLQPFGFFDFTPVGLAVTLTSIIFMATAGRLLLPNRVLSNGNHTDSRQLYNLHERLFKIHIPAGSTLDGKTIAESHLGSALDLNIIGIIRHNQLHHAPTPETMLYATDQLVVEGQPDHLLELSGNGHLFIEAETADIDRLNIGRVAMVELTLPTTSPLVGQTLHRLDFRDRYGVNVLALRRNDLMRRTNLQNLALKAKDILLVQSTSSQIETLKHSPDFLFKPVNATEIYRLHERMLVAHIPPESSLVSKTLYESRLGVAFGLTVLGIIREGNTTLVPKETTTLMANDTLLLEGKPQDLGAIQGLIDLQIDAQNPLTMSDLESTQAGLVEAVLSPHTTLIGQTLREMQFRAKYGLTVLAIWHAGRAYHSNLHNRPLHFGDALLLYGPRQKLSLLGNDPEFLALTENIQPIPSQEKAPLAIVLMSAVVITAIMGWLPIYIAAIIGATLMVIGGCLTMEEAYHHIEWKAVFLIAGMLPLGLAVEQSGAAQFLADGMVTGLAGFGPLAIITSLFILTALAAYIMPNVAAVVLLAPIAMAIASHLCLSPQALLMTIAVASAASFLSPVSHPANALIMGPGGYRFADYLKVGLPLSLTVLLVVLLILPLIWPIHP